VGVYIYEPENIAIRNRNITEYGSETGKWCVQEGKTQEGNVGTWDRNRKKNKNRNLNWD